MGMGGKSKGVLRYLQPDSVIMRLSSRLFRGQPDPLHEAPETAPGNALDAYRQRMAAAALAISAHDGGDSEIAMKKLRRLHPGIRELRMRNHISSIWTDGEWRAALGRRSKGAPISSCFARADLILDEISRCNEACDSLRSKLSLRMPSLKEMAEAIMAHGALSESQIRNFPSAKHPAISGKDLSEFLARVRKLRQDELPNAWRRENAGIVSAASLFHKSRFTGHPLSPDESALLSSLVDGGFVGDCGREALGLSFSLDLSATPLGEGIRERLYQTPDPLAEAARASMEFDTLLDFLGIGREKASVEMEWAKGLSKARSEGYGGAECENGDSRTSARVSLSGGRSFVMDMVFDGVSGQEGASLASTIAKDTFEIASISGWIRGPEDVRMAMLLADIIICMEKDRTGLLDMGTTATVSYVEGDRFFGIHAGDSEYRVIRNGMQEMESVSHGTGSVIWSGLGIGPREVMINNSDDAGFRPLMLEDGDFVLTMTDGVGDVLCHHEQAGLCAAFSHDEALAERKIFDLADGRKDPYVEYRHSADCRPRTGKDDDMTLIVRRIRLEK